MKVIMLKDVGGVGRRGTAVEVSDGYALNSLIPKGQAIQATAEKLAALQATEKRDAAAHAAHEAEMAKQARLIDGATLVVTAKANQNGTLFSQLPAELVIAAIQRAFSISIAPEAIMLNAPIRQIGQSTAKIKLGQSSANVTIDVVQAQ